MEAIVCPLCTGEMAPRPGNPADPHFHIFVCPGCRAELRQPLDIRPNALPSAPEVKLATDCPDCAFSQLQCCGCGDPVCDQHVRNVDQYLHHFSDDLRRDLEESERDRIYCPLCFQNMLKRVALQRTRGNTPKKKAPRLFNIKGMLLILLLLVIVIGLRSCEAAKPFLPGNQNNEGTEITDG